MTSDPRFLSGLPVLAAVIESKSFVHAGEALGLTQSGVSRAIQRLEDRLGLRFFERTSKMVRLTEEGKSFCEEALPLLAQLEEVAEARDPLAIAKSDNRPCVSGAASSKRQHRTSMKILALLTVVLLSLAGTKASADALATALGATGAQGMFCNYMAIAELADLYGGNSYDKKKTNELASMYGKLTETAKDSLTDLIDSGKLDKDDTAAVQQMVVINGLLTKMAASIEEYVGDPSKENEAAYQKNRQKAWNALSKFLGLEDK